MGEGSQDTPYRNKEGGYSVTGSNNNDLYYLVPAGNGRKRGDHLKHIEKKMS